MASVKQGSIGGAVWFALTIACPEMRQPSVVVATPEVSQDAGPEAQQPLPAAEPLQVGLDDLPDATERGTLEPIEGKRRARTAARFSGGSVSVEFDVADDGERMSDRETLAVFFKGRHLECSIPLSGGCAARLVAERRGRMLLACQPFQVGDNGCQWEYADWRRDCMLVDLEANTCRRYPMFLDLAWTGPQRLEAIVEFGAELKRLPTQFSELIDQRKVLCEGRLGPCKHCPPARVVGVELVLVDDGGLTLSRVLGELPCSEQSCDRRYATTRDYGPRWDGGVRLGCRARR